MDKMAFYYREDEKNMIIESVGLIASDIDGTLLGSDGMIPDENVKAIHEAQEKGIIFSIASGRFPENAMFKVMESGISCPIIGSNGACIMDEHFHILSSCHMDSTAVASVYEILRRHGADFFLFGPGMLCTSNESRKHHSELLQKDRLETIGFSHLHGIHAVEQCLSGPVQKFFVCNNVPLEPLYRDLSTVQGISLTRSAPDNIEVMPYGVDKGYGVRKISEYYHIPLSQIMTLGDEENDLPMIRIAGFGIAMGNASDAVKHAARYVTDTNLNAGLARAIRKYAL